MNVFEKLQLCRVELQKSNLKKSGKNKFAGFEYFELGDFLPKVNELFNDHKLFSNFNIVINISDFFKIIHFPIAICIFFSYTELRNTIDGGF